MKINVHANKGQTIVEFAIISVLLIALIFGIMDIARLSWTMFHLNGAAFAAVRAVSVNKSPAIAANYVTMRTLGLPCSVTINKTNIATKSNFAIYPLSKDDLKIYSINATILFYYDPIFKYGSWKAGVPIKVTSRMQTEIPNPLP
ncbi:MAG: pilus assembly protein [Elusimicrobia bacterium]|nr:pilus assembly protein [Elusimicrobiota bacterium]